MCFSQAAERFGLHLQDFRACCSKAISPKCVTVLQAACMLHVITHEADFGKML